MGSNYRRNLILQVVATIIVLAVAGLLYIFYEREHLKKEKYNELALVANLKSSEISKHFDAEMEDSKLIASDIFVVDRINRFLNGERGSNLNLVNKFKSIEVQHDYRDVLLATLDGKLLASGETETRTINSVLEKSIKDCLALKKVVSTDIYKSENNDDIRYDFLTPVFNKKKEPIAVIIFRKDPFQELFPMIQSWPLPSTTAENLIVRKDGNDVLFLSELRFKKNAALNLRIPITDRGIPAVEAALGISGIFEGIDYRGLAVLSDIRHIAGTNWFLVTKVDTSEIYEELNYRTALTVVIVMLLMFFSVSGFALFHYYRQREHYKELFGKEREVRTAHEEFRKTLYSIGDGVITTDTHSRVKQMNYIAEKLTGWKEEEAIGRTIQEVFEIINEDSRKTVENPVERVLREGVVVGLANHTLLVSKDGNETPIADSGAPIKQSEGNIEGVVLVFRDQIEERNNLNRLEESRNRFLSLYNSMHEGVALHDLVFDSENKAVDYRIVDVNPQYEAILSMKKESVINKLASELYGIGVPPFLDKYSEVALTKVHQQFEVYFAPLSKHFRISVIPWLTNGFATIFEDITERKNLETRTNRLANVIESSLNEIYIFDAEALKFVYANSGALQNIRYTMEELKSLTAFNIKPKYSEELFRETIKPLLSGEKEQLIFETVHKRKDGTEYPVEVHLQMSRAEEKPLFVAIINDISIRKQNEEALRDSEEQFRKMFEAASVGMVQAIPRDGRIIRCNDKFCDIVGYSREELLNSRFSDLTFEDDRKEDWEKFNAAVRGETPSHLIEKRYVRKDGSLIWARVNASIIRDDSGTPIKTITVIEDISERKKMEEIIKQRIVTLTEPVTSNQQITFDDLFNIDDIQKLQDDFSAATGVASIITMPDGTPITKPSNFCRLCSDIIRNTEKGLNNCMKSDSVLGGCNPHGPTIQPCLSGGLWDAGASINVGGKHIANWLIGQVRNEEIDIEHIIDYADEIGVDKNIFNEALSEVPVMSKEKFESVAEALFTFAKELSSKAYQNIQQARFISERGVIEKALRDREQKLSVTLQSIGDAVIATDVNGIIVNMNHIAERLTAFTLKEAFNKPLTEVFNIVNAQTRVKVENPVERVIHEGEIIGLANHTVLIARDGNEYQIADSAAPIKEANGKITGVVLVFRDQTEEYKAQLRLEENERKFRTIFDTSPDAITISRLSDGKFVDFNNGFCQLAGFTREEAIGKTAVELNIWYDPVQRNALISALLEKHYVDNMEIMFRKKDGRIIICYTSSRLITVGGNQYILAVNRDVTDKVESVKELERYRNHLEEMIDLRTNELNAANQKLMEEIEKEKEVEVKLEETLLREQELSQLKSRFISTTSHEFRTPLTTVLSSAELIQRNIKKLSEEKIIEYTNRIKNSVAYLTKLLEDVITLNKADSGKLVYEPRKINLRALCHEIMETSYIFAKDTHKIVFNYFPTETHFDLDEKLMRFILSNLMVNAYKYSPEGGMVTFLVEKNEKELIFKIEDEGIGIPEEDKLHLFEPFHRSKNCDDIPGTGLGLSIVKKSVEIQNGTISFESELMRGTRFMVSIPQN